MSAVLSPADVSAKLLDVQAVAEMLGCSARHIYRLSDSGRMPAPVKLGALVRWNRAAIESWVAAGCPSARTLKGAARRVRDYPKAKDKVDQRLWEAWAEGHGQYRTLEELALAKGISKREVQLALDRRRKRLERAGKWPPGNPGK